MLKRLMMMLPVLMVGYVAGHVGAPRLAQAQVPAVGQGGRGQAQGASEQSGGRGQPGRPPAAANLFLVTGTPETRAVNGKAVLWTKAQLRDAVSHIQWAPEYRLTMTTRPTVANGAAPPNLGELHTDNTQIYVITSGSGSVLIEGTVTAENDYLVAQGEHRGGPITGGRVVKVKEGDVLSIPPFTWHTAYGDPGTPLTYLMFHIHTRQTIP